MEGESIQKDEEKLKSLLETLKRKNGEPEQARNSAGHSTRNTVSRNFYRWWKKSE